ncbi:acetyltransferase (GNAT) domain-containing protein [Ditylenchus destructor]|uniref:Acetyltransferase (GNAT) domain-containing protein n=1 Tax=Ditylenchus destructor TaxID=166010 RepID=A0AAD4QWY7_9BILA|nr:acetyltransferase (GNAT) domain-containing protein [Ditylenchus destructor]
MKDHPNLLGTGGQVICRYKGEDIGVLDYNKTAEKVMNISNLNTAPVYQRKGVGNALVEYFIANVVKAGGFNTVTVSVANGGRNNTGAKKTYEKNGFQWDADDKDTMTLKL